MVGGGVSASSGENVKQLMDMLCANWTLENLNVTSAHKQTVWDFRCQHDILWKPCMTAAAPLVTAEAIVSD
ncbi:MAG: hypothetical protein ACKESB_03490 [Candidatus Hodgkinia cicadicola]